MSRIASAGTAEVCAPVLYEVVDGIAIVTINRPEARNALNRAVRELLFTSFRRFEGDDEARVMVLTGAGAAFCAGADLKELVDESLGVPPIDFIPQIGRNVTVSKPVIGAINGACRGGGFLLAQSCDLLLAAESATFAISEVKVGRGAPWAAPLVRKMPPALAMQMLLTGNPVSAARAHEVGFVNDVLPDTDLLSAGIALAATICDAAPLSVDAARSMVHHVVGSDMPKLFAEAEQIWRHVYESADAQEGAIAFLERRAPRWTGR